MSSSTGRVRANFDTLKANYPTYNRLPKRLQDFMDRLNKGIPEDKPHNTPCCVQVSHALNLAGQKVPPSSWRRSNSPIQANWPSTPPLA